MSGYRASPRPTFDAPTAIPFASVTRHLWGDDESGEVADWIYVSSDKIHQLVFGLRPGGWFRHSNEYRTIFAADIVYYVLAGTLLLANPATGEVRRIGPGEAGFFRRDTWHHAMNHSQEPLRVLELFAPPPATGSSGAYARTQPLLTGGRYIRDDLLGRWPEAEERERTQATIRVIREIDLLWRIEGDAHPRPVALLVSTVHLTVGRIALLPGERTDWTRHAGDESLYVTDG
ncbi:MAG TPA: cupin domain-containing protein, partial [Thermomicrobiales bacterium]|nr:cupin domain-containing protein [Thermomicrobiales bacterium]